MADGKVTDTLSACAATLPTIEELADKGAKVIVLSHFDRPRGKVVPSMSLRPVAEPLAKELGLSGGIRERLCRGPEAEKAVKALKDGGILLLENTRFHPGEEKNDLEFRQSTGRAGRHLRQ